MAAILPPAVAKWQFVEEKARAVLDAFGFREVRTPLLLPDGRPRPGGVDGLLQLAQGDVRWYELGPVFRGAEQLAQIRGVVTGASGADAEAELIGMLAALVAEAGVPAATVLLPADKGSVSALLGEMGVATKLGAGFAIDAQGSR